MTDATEPVDAVVNALLTAVGDAESNVSSAANTALVRLGGKEPARVLPALLCFVRSASPSASITNSLPWAGLSHGQRMRLLNTAAEITSSARLSSPAALSAESLLQSALEEALTAADEEMADAAGGLVAEACKLAPAEAMASLVARCPADAVPHPGVLRALGDLAQASPPVVVPTLQSELLPRLLPLIGGAKGDVRVALGQALHHFAQAIASVHGPGSQHVNGGGPDRAEIGLALETLLAEWIPSRAERVREAASEAIGSLVVLLSPHVMRGLVARLLPGLLAAQRHEAEWERLPLTTALWAVMLHAEACDLGREMHSEQLLLPALSSLHSSLCQPLDRTSAACLRNHNEELRCLEVLGNLAIQPTAAHLTSQLDGAESRETPAVCGTLEVMRHLVQRTDARLDVHLPALLASIGALLPTSAASSHRVRLSIAQLVGALGTRGALLTEGGRPLLTFLLKQAALADPEPEEASGGGGARLRLSPEAFGTMEVKRVSSKALELLASTVPSMRHVLWSLLLPPLLSDEYVHASPIVCQIMIQIGHHYVQHEPHALALAIGEARSGVPTAQVSCLGSSVNPTPEAPPVSAWPPM